MFKGIITFFKDCRTELTKTTWPDRNQVVRLTGIVFFVCAVMMVFFLVIDFGLSNLIRFILG
ncbi:MAG: preprotein translocase subunit SecE [SAR324 cluster bacterium]|nr:preprotein translocase subunit SecE [SAR324 cluster bacterium]